MRTKWTPWLGFAAGIVLAVVLSFGGGSQGTLLGSGREARAVDRAATPGPATTEVAGAADRLSIQSAPATAASGGSAPATSAGVRGRTAALGRAIDASLEARLEQHVRAAFERAASSSGGAAGAVDCRVAYRVVDLERNLVIAEREPQAWMEPASNLKLLTTLAALRVLGPDWRFRTSVEALGPIADGRLAGDLLVRAGGDPFYAPDDPGYAERRLDSLARALVARGIGAIEGDLLLDLGAFPEPGPARGWPDSNVQWTGSYAYVAGLTANGGQLRLDFEAGADGRTRVALAPAPSGLDFSGSVAASSRSINDVRIGLYDASGRLTVDGELGPPGRVFDRDLRHPRPTEMFGALLSAALKRQGIALRGEVRQVRGEPVGEPIAVLETPLEDLLVAINRDSVNPVADAVFLAMGLERFGEPTREAARAAVAEVLGELGLQTSGFVQVGGSGLSRDNRVSPAMLVEALRQVDRMPAELRESLVSSLAVAGESGTLAERMQGTAAEGRVVGKTGFIVGASALSGFAQALDGGRYAFSIVVSYPRLGGLNNSAWKPMHDAIAVELVERRAR